MHIQYSWQLGLTLVQLARCATLTETGLELLQLCLAKVIEAFHLHWYNSHFHPEVSNR